MMNKTTPIDKNRKVTIQEDSNLTLDELEALAEEIRFDIVGDRGATIPRFIELSNIKKKTLMKKATRLGVYKPNIAKKVVDKDKVSAILVEN